MHPNDHYADDEQLTKPQGPYPWGGAPPVAPPPAPSGPPHVPPWLTWVGLGVLALAIITLGEYGIAGRWPWQGGTGTTTLRATSPTTTISVGGTPAPLPTPTGNAGASTCSAAGFGTSPASTGNPALAFPFVAGTFSHSQAPDADHEGYQTRTLALCFPGTSSTQATAAQHGNLSAAGWTLATSPTDATATCGADCWQTTLHAPPTYAEGTRVYASLATFAQNGQVSTTTLALTVAPYQQAVPFSGVIALDATSTGDIQTTDATHFITIGNAAYAALPADLTAATATCAAISNLPFSTHRNAQGQREPIAVDPTRLVALKSNQTRWALAHFTYTSQGLQIAWYSYSFCLN